MKIKTGLFSFKNKASKHFHLKRDNKAQHFYLYNRISVNQFC